MKSLFLLSPCIIGNVVQNDTERLNSFKLMHHRFERCQDNSAYYTLSRAVSFIINNPVRAIYNERR